jgi:hypothetical protein
MKGSWGHHSPREISADKDVPSAAESRKKKLRPVSPRSVAWVEYPILVQDLREEGTQVMRSRRYL